MQNRMKDMVHAVEGAVHDAEAAKSNREVVDLGQSLHLLETKFSGLREALAQELGAKSSKMHSHSGVARELMDQSTDLVKGIVNQREELRRLSSDVKEVDSAIRALREGLNTFEKDVNDLNRLAGDLHVSHNELSVTHEEARDRVREVIVDVEGSKNSSSHGLLYAAILIEFAVFVGFLYFKRPGGALAHKAYGKFG